MSGIVSGFLLTVSPARFPFTCISQNGSYLCVGQLYRPAFGANGAEGGSGAKCQKADTAAAFVKMMKLGNR
jgi:hypothetical protein